MSQEFQAAKQATVANINAYYEGMKEGIRMYSWMKDGVTYVGTCGWTLKEELAKVDAQRADRLETIHRMPDGIPNY